MAEAATPTTAQTNAGRAVAVYNAMQKYSGTGWIAVSPCVAARAATWPARKSAAYIGALNGGRLALATSSAVAGLFAAPLGGLAIDADRDSLAGVLIRLGVPECEAGMWERQIQAGHALLVVRVDWRAEEAEQILDRVGAARVSAGCWPCTGAAGGASTNPTDPPLIGEPSEFDGSILPA